MSEAPDLIRPLIGYRTWAVYPSYCLCSPVRRVVWPTADLDARCGRCERLGHEIPNAGCSCGIYAHYRPGTRPGTRRYPAGRRVWGAVAMEGVCLLHAAGLRSARARIVALRTPDGAPTTTIEGLRERYRVPVLVGPLNELMDEALKHGDHAPRTLIPDPPSVDAIRAHLASTHSPTAAQTWANAYLAALQNITAATTSMQQLNDANTKALAQTNATWATTAWRWLTPG